MDPGSERAQFGTAGHRDTIIVPMPPFPQPGLLRRIDLRGVSGDPASFLPAPLIAQDEEAGEAVRAILEEVRSGGDAALREMTGRYDGVSIDAIRVPDEELRAALRSVSPELR